MNSDIRKTDFRRYYSLIVVTFLVSMYFASSAGIVYLLANFTCNEVAIFELSFLLAFAVRYLPSLSKSVFEDCRSH